MGTTTINLNGINELVLSIQTANKFFLDQTQRQVNTSLTLRNWVIGYYIVEYEQKGEDRAAYGKRLVRNLSELLSKAGIKGLSFTILQVCKQFYLTYPQIVQAVTEQLLISGSQSFKIVQQATEQFAHRQNPVDLLIGRLSFTHFVELIRLENSLKRLFYETEAIVNNWSVRELQRAVDSMLYERTGLSKDKEAVLEPLVKYATAGLPHHVLVSRYMTSCPVSRNWKRSCWKSRGSAASSAAPCDSRRRWFPG